MEEGREVIDPSYENACDLWSYSRDVLSSSSSCDEEYECVDVCVREMGEIRV